jgi:hypothetical protein
MPAADGYGPVDLGDASCAQMGPSGPPSPSLARFARAGTQMSGPPAAKIAARCSMRR